MKLLAVNPDFEPAENTDEDTVDFYDKLKSNMLMQPLGDLRVTSEPAGATIYLDGRIVGMTPMKIEGITAGKHYWRIHKNGYRDAGGIVTVRDGSEAKITESLPVATGADRIPAWEKEGAGAFGTADMMKKAVDIGLAAKVGRLALFHTAIEEGDAGTMVKVQMRLINPEKASFKEESISFSLPARGEMTRSDDLRASLDNLFADKYGFNPVSTILSGSLSTDGGKKKGGDSGIVGAWWFWTIIGVGVASAVTIPLLLVPSSPAYIGGEGGGTGASMTIQFGN